MRISRIALYRVPVELTQPHVISGGRIVTTQDVSVVALHGEDGTVGWGECSPWGPLYTTEFPEGVQAAMQLLGAALVGAEADDLTALGALADATMLGQPLAKSAFGTAALDLLGRRHGLSATRILGGARNPGPRHAQFLHVEEDEDTVRGEIARGRSQGRPCFEYKASGDRAQDIEMLRFVTSELRPEELLKVDANGGWLPVDAAAIMQVSRGHNVLFEQPCATLDQLRHLRGMTARPIALDEGATSLEQVVVAHREGVCNALNVKFDRLGGPLPARDVAAVATALGIPVMVQAVGGSALATGAIVSLARTLPARNLIYIWHPSRMAHTRTATGIVDHPDGTVGHDAAAPGLGVEIDPEIVGAPVSEFG